MVSYSVHTSVQHITFKSQWLRESHSLPCMFGQLPLPGGHQNRTPLVLKRSNAFVLKPVNLKPSRIPLLPNEDFDQNRNICQNLSNHLSTCPPPQQNTSNILPYSPPAILMGSFGAGNPPNFALCSCCACCAWEVRPPKKKSGGNADVFFLWFLLVGYL